MFLTFCTGKIHRCRVTDAHLDYPGSITIDRLLAKAAGFFEGQQVTINSLADGASWQTYVVFGPDGKGDICLNGPPAHHFKKGDMVIILAYGMVASIAAKDVHPTVVLVDGKNQIIEVKEGNI